MFKGNFLYFGLCLLPPGLSVATTEKHLALSSLHPHKKHLFIHISKTHTHTLDPLSSMLNNPSALSLSWCTLGSPGLDSTLQKRPEQCWAKMKDLLPWPVGSALPNATRRQLSSLQGTLLVYSQLDVYHDPKVLFCKPASQQPVLVYGVIPPQMQCSAFPFVELLTLKGLLSFPQTVQVALKFFCLLPCYLCSIKKHLSIAMIIYWDGKIKN